MNLKADSCPKCGQSMEEGFVVDQSFTNYVPSIWVQGRPEPSFLTVTKISDKIRRLVTSYRCVGCGYLESYATNEWTGKINPQKA